MPRVNDAQMTQTMVIRKVSQTGAGKNTAFSNSISYRAKELERPPAVLNFGHRLGYREALLGVSLKVGPGYKDPILKIFAIQTCANRASLGIACVKAEVSFQHVESQVCVDAKKAYSMQKVWGVPLY